MSEVDGVEVAVEDLVLRQLVLDAKGHGGGLDLPPGRVVVSSQIEVLDELLGDRARLLCRARVADVVDERATDPDQIHPVVPVETLVLRVHDGLPIDQMR